MKNKPLLMLLLLLSAGAHAQTLERQVIGSAGGSYSGSSFAADHTTGEAITATGSSGSFVLTQGFHQLQAGGTAISEKGLLVNFSLYPNPASDVVTLSLQAATPFALRTSMTNIAGQIIYADPAAEKITQRYERQVPVHGLAAGIYFINLYDEASSLLQSIRFVKQ